MAAGLDSLEEYKKHKAEMHQQMVMKQNVPYSIKRRMAESRIKEFYNECQKRGLNCHVSVGGLDSIVLGSLIREMRLLLQKARIDYTILNNPEGGYYRPSRENLQELSRYIRQEEKRAKSIFKDVKRAKRIYADYLLGRLEQEGE